MRRTLLAVITLLAGSPLEVEAGEIGHYAPGALSIRDYAMPAPGIWGSLYNVFYQSDRINDRNGDQISSVPIGPTSINIDVDVDLYAAAPTFIWISNWKLLGAKYGAYLEPQLTNSSVGAAFTTATGSGRSVEESQFDLGDPLIQPLWLGWAKTHWDVALGYGFYPPIGRYNTETVTLPVVGPIKTESSDNIGLGFWTHQIQGAVTAYPAEHHGTAVTAALTWEIHGKKKGFDLTPGQNLSLNWGVSQFLPLKEDKSLLLEVGPAGYSTWQVTDDRGSSARNPDVHDNAHAVGGQAGVTVVPWKAAFNFHYFHEYSAVDRFQGRTFGVNLAKGF